MNVLVDLSDHAHLLSIHIFVKYGTEG